jgi:hypothetical protein
MKVSYHAVFFFLLAGQVTSQSFGNLPGGSSQSCTFDADCPPIQCLIAPCPAAVCTDGTCGIEENPPSPECVMDSDCPPISCFTTPCEQHVCNEGLCGPPSTRGVDQVESGIPCGPTICTNGEPCCNESCGYCGQLCTEEFCMPEGDDVNFIKPSNDTFVCKTDTDCPNIQCLVPPCDQHVCNTTSGVCIPTEASDDTSNDTIDETPCQANSTCGDSIGAEDLDDPLLANRASDSEYGSESDSDGSRYPSKSGSARQLVILQSMTVAAAALFL